MVPSVKKFQKLIGWVCLLIVFMAVVPCTLQGRQTIGLSSKIITSESRLKPLVGPVQRGELGIGSKRIGLNSDSLQSQLKSKKLGVWLSVLNTFVPILGSLFINAEKISRISTLYGVVAGPSLGHLYAEDYGQSATGIGIRLISSGVTFVGGRLVLYQIFCGIYGGRCGNEELAKWGTAILIGGAVITLGSMLYDLVTPDNSVAEYNKEIREKMALIPYIRPELQSAGLTLRVSF